MSKFVVQVINENGDVIRSQETDMPDVFMSGPDLLAACELALELETSVTQGEYDRLHNGYAAKLRAAIAKARNA